MPPAGIHLVYLSPVLLLVVVPHALLKSTPADRSLKAFDHQAISVLVHDSCRMMLSPLVSGEKHEPVLHSALTHYHTGKRLV